MPLLNRQSQIPGGLRFVQAELRWQSQPWASFDVIVNSLIAARNAHPALVTKYQWATDYATVANEVDNFNTRICQQMGWGNYITAGGGGQPAPPPFLPAAVPTDPGKLAAAANAVKAIWAGVRTLNDWLDSGTPPVDATISTARAAVCAACPKNTPGDFSQWFTKPASEAIRRQLEKVQDRKLSTPDDAKLNVCAVCLCPMRLKVHTPIAYVKAHMTEEILTQLRAVPGCWIPKELQ
jgi:hypothetical protein